MDVEEEDRYFCPGDAECKHTTCQTARSAAMHGGRYYDAQIGAWVCLCYVASSLWWSVPKKLGDLPKEAQDAFRLIDMERDDSADH